MTIHEAAKRLNQRKMTLTIAVLVGTVLAMFASFTRPLQYSTTSTFIVIQEQRFSDPYTQARSAEYLAGLLARIVDTDTFRNSVLGHAPAIRAYLPATSDNLRRTWSNDVSVQTVADTGLLSVTAYHGDPAAAQSIVAAIGATLTSDSGTYLGTATPVKLLQIDGPTNSRIPVRPNLGVNMLAGAVLGFVIAAGWFLIDRKTKQSVFPTRRTFNWAPSFSSVSRSIPQGSKA